MHGVVMERLAVEVMAGLPDDEARAEVAELLQCVREQPRAHPDVREVIGAEVREAFGAWCWVRYAVHEGAVEVRDIGWAA